MPDRPLSAFDAAGFTFLHLDPADTAAIGRHAADTELPALGLSVARLQELSVQQGPTGARRYLLDLIARRSFAFAAPKTGEEVASGSSVVLSDRSVIYSFPRAPSIGVAAVRLGEGFPLSAIIDFDRRIVVSIDDPVWGFHTRHLDMLASFRTSWTAGEVTEPKSMYVLGEQNFAHYALNQLPVVPDLMDAARSGTVALIVTHQPLGTVQSLFPELAWDEHLVSENDLHAMNRDGALFIGLGSSRVTAEVARRVLESGRRALGSQARRVMQETEGNWPRLWISVRTSNRTPSNQHDLLFVLGRRFLQTYAAGCIVIDGLSLPADFESGADRIYSRASFSDILEHDVGAARTLWSALNELRPGAAHLAVGLGILDSIVLAGIADFYFCHHGTVQHKIGWFHAKPGMIHAGTAIISHRPSDWVASKSEMALPPAYLDIGLVRDSAAEESDDPRIRELMRGNYHVDVQGAVQQVMNTLRAVLGNDGETRRTPSAPEDGMLAQIVRKLRRGLFQPRPR